MSREWNGNQIPNHKTLSHSAALSLALLSLRRRPTSPAGSQAPPSVGLLSPFSPVCLGCAFGDSHERCCRGRETEADGCLGWCVARMDLTWTSD
ncbi:hypothetical protein LINPERHAP2_LOCUS13295, partial [Linum perenne]